jgi:WD40 repeat protein
MASRKTCVAGVAVFFGLCAFTAVFCPFSPLRQRLRSLLREEKVIAEYATRTEGDWQVTSVGQLHFARYFREQDRLLVSSKGMRPELWDTRQGQRVAVLRECPPDIDTAALSPDGERFVTGDRVDNPHGQNSKELVRSLRVWETATGKLVKTIDIDLRGARERDTTDWSATWCDQRTLLLELYRRENPARFSGGTVLMRVDIEREKVLKKSLRIPFQGGMFHEGMDLSPDRKRAVAGVDAGAWRREDGGVARAGKTHKLALVDMDALAVVAPLEAGPERSALWQSAWSPDSRWLAAAAADDAVRVWDARDGRLVATLKGHTDTVLDIDFSPDGRTLLTAGDDDTARLWDLTTGELVRTLAGHTAGLTQAVFDADGARVLTGGEDMRARLWEAATGKQLRVWPDHESGVREVAFAADGKEVRTRTARGVERVWSVDDGKLVSEKKPEGGARDCYGACFLRKGSGGEEIWVGSRDAVPPPLRDDD